MMNLFENRMYDRRVVSRFAATAIAIEVLFFCGGNWCVAAILLPNAPSGGRQIVSRNLDSEFLGGARIDELIIAEPVREYFVGLTNLAPGSLLSKAKPGGWRYTISHGTNGLGAAILNADENSGKVRGFNSLQRPGFAQEMLVALRTAENLSQAENRNYEIRFLNVPTAHFVALWLHGESDDILIPLPPTFERMSAYQSYSEDQIIEILARESTADE